jgi:hypothetical protein
VHDAHLFLLPIHTQSGLELVAAGRNGANFSQCSTAWGSFPRARGSVCNRVSLFLGVVFSFMVLGSNPGPHAC